MQISVLLFVVTCKPEQKSNATINLAHDNIFCSLSFNMMLTCIENSQLVFGSVDAFQRFIWCNGKMACSNPVNCDTEVQCQYSSAETLPQWTPGIMGPAKLMLFCLANVTYLWAVFLPLLTSTPLRRQFQFWEHIWGAGFLLQQCIFFVCFQYTCSDTSVAILCSWQNYTSWNTSSKWKLCLVTTPVVALLWWVLLLLCKNHFFYKNFCIYLANLSSSQI